MADNVDLDLPETVVELLAERGPMSEDELVAILRGRGLVDPDAVLDVLLDEVASAARQLVDERWVWLPALLAGRVFTHRLAAHEIAHDLLDVAPDLGPIIGLCDHAEYQRLADGSPVALVDPILDAEVLAERGIPHEAVDDLGGLLLEPGTLDALGVRDGDMIGLRLAPDGLVLEATGEPASPPGTLATRLSATVEAGEPVFFDAAVWTICADDAGLFAEPIPPLSKQIEDIGLTRQGEWLAPADFDFVRWRMDLHCARLMSRYDIDEDEAFAVAALVTVYDRFAMVLQAAADDQDAEEAESDPPELEQARAELLAGPDSEMWAVVARTAEFLAEPVVAQALLLETIGTGRAGAAALGMFAETAEPRVPRAVRVAFRWLRGVALERLGDVAAAEREYLAAESLDPEWPLPLLELARFASDRGDAERGLGLLRRVGAGPDHPLVALLEEYHTPQRPDVGRNQPCWCGSGRKYKKCHLGRERVPLPERADWLSQKAGLFVLGGPWRDLLVEAGEERSRYAEDDDVDPLEAALSDPLVMDAVLFEGGAFAEFLDVRGDLLPDDERLLAEQWLLAERSVFEVLAVHRGEGVSVRDLRTGDVHEVTERLGSRQLGAGQLVCTRAVPIGDTIQFFGGIEPVALHERDELIRLLDSEPDPLELVAYLTRRFAPHTLANTEGDPLVFCEATLEARDPDALAAALDETYDRVDDAEPPRWFEHVTTHGQQRIRATLRLEQGELRVDTNSEARMDRVLDSLRRIDPGLAVSKESRRPMRDTREAAAMAKQLPSTGESALLDPADPVVAAALEEFARDYETKWLDEPIPALSGYTPRQAADDPTRRDDLIKLIDSFPADDAPGAMSPDRLRAALDL